MNKRFNAWPLLSAIAGLALVTLALFSSKDSLFKSQEQKPVGQVAEVFGEALIQNEDLKSEPLKEKTEIRAMDNISVAEDSEVVILLSPEDEVRLLANSEVSFNKTLTRTNLVLKKGELQVLKSSEQSLTDVSRDGQLIPLTTYEAWIAAQNIKRKIKKATAWDAGSEKELSPEDIRNTLEKHRNTFVKCYSQLLQKKPQVKGSISLSFRIERSGHVNQAQVSSAQLTDQNFKGCLLEALQRVEFKSFTGEPISTVFPLQFE